MYVASWLAIKIDFLVASPGIYRRRRFDDFDIKTPSKGLEVREDELAVLFNVCCGQHVVELCEAECDEYTKDTCIVGEVEI